MSIKDHIRSAVRTVGSPFRNFFNAHFEMTKDEIRRSTEQLAGSLGMQQLAELSNVISETQIHNARIIAELRREVASLRAEVAELTATSQEVASVVAASTLVPLDDGPLDAGRQDGHRPGPTVVGTNLSA